MSLHFLIEFSAHLWTATHTACLSLSAGLLSHSLWLCDQSGIFVSVICSLFCGYCRPSAEEVRSQFLYALGWGCILNKRLSI